jgi:hypothetical protein
MTLAWSPEWLEQQCDACVADATYQEEAEGLDRSFTVVVRANPARGVTEDASWGFYVPTMINRFIGEPPAATDFYLDGGYDEWHAVNEGKKGLVESLLDESIALRAGSTSYLAMFVPAVERFFELSRSITTAYAGDYERL